MPDTGCNSELIELLDRRRRAREENLTGSVQQGVAAAEEKLAYMIVQEQITGIDSSLFGITIEQPLQVCVLAGPDVQS